MEIKLTDSAPTPIPLKVKRRPRREKPKAETGAKVAPLPPASPSEVLERGLRELGRYYRHSGVGQRTLGLVHQMNTPLQVLSFHLELLEQKAREELPYLAECPFQVAQALRELHQYRLEKWRQFRREVENIQALARRLLHQGIHEENAELLYLDLKQIYQEELELYLANPFFKHRVTKECRFQDLPPIYGHYLDFSQSFRNLIDNALEAMEGGERRELTVETALEGGCRILRVRDTGVGIPRKILQRIFDPFFTTKGTPEAPRAGLGLFMARRLLTPYRGRIHVQSQPGNTLVTVSLPVKPGVKEKI